MTPRGGGRPPLPEGMSRVKNFYLKKRNIKSNLSYKFSLQVSKPSLFYATILDFSKTLYIIKCVLVDFLYRSPNPPYFTRPYLIFQKHYKSQSVSVEIFFRGPRTLPILRDHIATISRPYFLFEKTKDKK